MRRSRPGAAAATAATAILLAWAAPPARAALPTMVLSDVRPGMVCTALSVVQGLEPVQFDGTVISVDGGPNPADALIVMRFSGDALGGAGIGEGYSGSPVSCPAPDGTPEVIGAISAGIGQFDNLVAGVTPIEAMLATPTFGTAPAAPAVGEPATQATKPARSTRAKSAKSGKASSRRARAARAATTASRTAASRTGATPSTPKPWGSGAMPLTLNGPRGALAARYQAAAANAGVSLLVSPTATRLQAPAAGGLKGGDAVAATSVDGDVTAGAIGTVTYVDGDRVWAFGHSYNGTGPSRILMERAQISTIINSPAIGDQVTYKLGSPVGPVGTIGFDGSSAVGGVLGPAPAMIPTNVTVRDAAGTVLQTAAARIVDERAVRGGATAQMLGLGASANAGTALQRLSHQSAVGGAGRTCTTIFLTGGAKPLYQCVDSVVPLPTSDGGVESGVAAAVALAVEPVTSSEQFLRLVQGVKVDVTLRPQADSLQIVKLRRPSKLVAGKTARVRVVVVQDSTGERREIPLEVRIPKAAAGERTGIVVVPDAAESAGTEATTFDDLFSDESLDESSPPRTLPGLRALYTTDGISGLRAIAVPGMSGKAALSALTDPTDSELSSEELKELASHAKLVYELPAYVATGGASLTVTPGF